MHINISFKIEIENDVPHLRNHAKFTFQSLQARSSTGSPLSQFLYPPSGSGPPHGPPPPPGASAAASSDPMASPPPAHVGAYLDKGKFSTQGYQLWTFYVQKWNSCHSISDIAKANAIFRSNRYSWKHCFRRRNNSCDCNKKRCDGSSSYIDLSCGFQSSFFFFSGLAASPLYSLPHTQYPYSMLGDQLAAW